VERRRDYLLTALALATGAMDAIAFLGLGGVFTSVMTGNMVLFGLGAGNRDGGLVARAGLALIGYVVGVAAGTRQTPSGDGVPGVWPGRATVLLFVELVVLVGFSIGWELAGGRPAGAAQGCLIFIAALALGIQSASMRALGVTGLSTTYLTGTLTTVVSELVDRRRPAGVARDLGILFALVAGAAIAGVVVNEVPRAAPAFPLAVLTAVIVGARVTFRRQRT
jgi:uncharacterized membrane protein YoaK (UPF0700 family)